MFNRILRNLITFCKSMVKWVISKVNVKENSPPRTDRATCNFYVVREAHNGGNY